MKSTIAVILLVAASYNAAHAQDMIKGLPITISLVPKSAKQPNLKLKDGSGISLKYEEAEGIRVILSKNGKQTDFCDPFFDTKLVQVGEVDIENDGKTEVVVANRSGDDAVEVILFKKAEFEVYYKEWSSFAASGTVEFPGDGSVKMYPASGSPSSFKISADGKVAGLE